MNTEHNANLEKIAAEAERIQDFYGIEVAAHGQDEVSGNYFIRFRNRTVGAPTFEEFVLLWQHVCLGIQVMDQTNYNRR